MSGHVVAVCGLKVEARVASGSGVVAIAGGGHADRLETDLERAISDGAIAVISFGIAGALIGGLRPGQLIVADRIVAMSTIFRTDARWSDALVEKTGALRASIAARDAIASTIPMKIALQDETRAAAVDMESHIAARVAARHGLPFATLRAIADPRDRSLPPAATIAMKEGGGIDLAAVFRSIARSPGQLPGLIAIARDTRAALSGLRHGRRMLGRGLGHADLDQLGIDMV